MNKQTNIRKPVKMYEATLLNTPRIGQPRPVLSKRSETTHGQPSLTAYQRSWGCEQGRGTTYSSVDLPR